MLSVLFSWIVILGITLLIGHTIIQYGYKGHLMLEKVDVYIICGLMFVNIYAEMFSIYYKVGAKACLGLLIIGCILFGGNVIKYRGHSRTKRMYILPIYRLIVMLFCVIATMIWTVGVPQHYDTSLYHFQAIKWIEEYGVVPGLGNLHNRFAYNSAFMPLQALFSFEWLTGQSLHTVNGFVCAFFLIYAVISNSLWKNERLQTSDLLKLATVIYVWYNRDIISSPSSDLFTMLLILYICTKWSEYEEKNISDAYSYAFLGILCIYAATLKLSAATCIILVTFPIIIFAKQKKYMAIIEHIIMGCIILIPWLARNVIISGYLLYPYPQSGLFNVDWKMPASILTYDSREIMVWGRGIHQVNEYNLPIWIWFPKWLENNNSLLLLLGLGTTVVCGIIFVIRIVKKSIDWKRDILFLYCIVTVIFWLFTSPLMRYGMVYLLVPICLCVSIILNKINCKMNLDAVFAVILIPIAASYLSNICNISQQPYLWQKDYEWRLTKEVELDHGVKIWVPVEGDQCSSDVFPCVPYENMVKRIELRGESLRDGFRVKAEYKSLHLQGDGTEW